MLRKPFERVQRVLTLMSLLFLMALVGCRGFAPGLRSVFRPSRSMAVQSRVARAKAPEKEPAEHHNSSFHDVNASLPTPSSVRQESLSVNTVQQSGNARGRSSSSAVKPPNASEGTALNHGSSQPHRRPSRGGKFSHRMVLSSDGTHGSSRSAPGVAAPSVSGDNGPPLLARLRSRVFAHFPDGSEHFPDLSEDDRSAERAAADQEIAAEGAAEQPAAKAKDAPKTTEAALPSDAGWWEGFCQAICSPFRVKRRCGPLGCRRPALTLGRRLLRGPARPPDSAPEPPPARFHPVPTQSVFAPRNDPVPRDHVLPLEPLPSPSPRLPNHQSESGPPPPIENNPDPEKNTPPGAPGETAGS